MANMNPMERMAKVMTSPRRRPRSPKQTPATANPTLKKVLAK